MKSRPRIKDAIFYIFVVIANYIIAYCLADMLNLKGQNCYFSIRYGEYITYDIVFFYGTFIVELVYILLLQMLERKLYK